MTDISNKGLAIYGVVAAAFCVGLGYLMATEKDAFMVDCSRAGIRPEICDVMYEQGPPPMKVPRP